MHHTCAAFPPFAISFVFLCLCIQAPEWAQKEEQVETSEPSSYYKNLSNTQGSDTRQREKAEAEIVAESSSDSDSDQEDSKDVSREPQDGAQQETTQPASSQVSDGGSAAEEVDHKSRRARARARMKAKAAASNSETVANNSNHDGENAEPTDQPDAPSLAQFNMQTPTVKMSSLSLPSQDRQAETVENHGAQNDTPASVRKDQEATEDQAAAETSGSEDSSEASDESDSDEQPSRPIAKPVFRKKEQRDTIREKEEQEREEEEQKRREEEEREQQREESRKMVVEEIRKERESEKQEEEDPTMPDDEDRSDDEEEEFNEWRLRELYRIKR